MQSNIFISSPKTPLPPPHCAFYTLHLWCFHTACELSEVSISYLICQLKQQEPISVHCPLANKRRLVSYPFEHFCDFNFQISNIDSPWTVNRNNLLSKTWHKKCCGECMMKCNIISREHACYGSMWDFNAQSHGRCPRYLKSDTEYGALFLITYFFSSGFTFTFSSMHKAKDVFE